MNYHEPVMLSECIDGLAIKLDGTYVDVTFGGGGHSRAVLERLGEKGKLIAFDRDEDAHSNTINDSRFTLIRDNYRTMKHHLQQSGNFPVNGILADLGVSSHQFDLASRGFSTRFEHNLDMRMDNRLQVTALDILNTYSEKALTQIFSAFGEVRNSKTLAATIVKTRSVNAFQGSTDFRNAIAHLVPKADESSYLAQVYQALRIEVNEELDSLVVFLEQSSECLAPEGRLVVMSYHSLEDRMVKNYISKGNIEGVEQKDFFGNTVGLKLKPITKKPITPSSLELKNNSRSRSAKLRIAVKF
jgi:16S rRNA (cytosine1402-N4)-methyltransferase